MILIIHMVMAVAPFGVAALIAEVVGQSGVSILSALFVYALTVIIGLTVWRSSSTAAWCDLWPSCRFIDFLQGSPSGTAHRVLHFVLVGGSADHAGMRRRESRYL